MNTKKIIETPPGFLLINKPKGANSFRAVAQIRRILQNRKLKAGYAGTLDPFANGLLVVGLQREATRLLHVITRWNKKYIAKAKLGERTDTLDNTGQVIEIKNTNVKEEHLLAAIKQLGNQYDQTPPIYSALKHNGVPLYKLARHKKKSVEILEAAAKTKNRTVQLLKLVLNEFTYPFFTIEAEVSHGTYIRTLVNDIAHNADSCATTHELERTSVGNITLEKAICLDSIKTPEDIINNIIEIEEFSTQFIEINGNE